MRTKTLLLTAALTAAGVIASIAGVTSVNVVGYINIDVPAGFSFVANQLVAANDKISALIPAPPTGTVVYSWDGGFVANSFNQFGDNNWDNNDLELGPGGGVLIYNPNAKDSFRITFVGEVKQGTLTTPVNQGFQFISSQVPQEGTISALGYTPSTGDVFYKWDGGFSADTYNSFGDNNWDSGTEPSLKVGQSALYFSTSGNDWVRTFNVQ